MSNWKNWIDSDDHRPAMKKRINKNIYCKKNKITSQHTRGVFFGPHIYEEGSKFCKLCGHKHKENIQHEQENDI